MKYILDWGTLSPINHIRLINRCYPTNPSEKSVPRSNKLSTLIFYANAKPAKLVKICKYLMHKIGVDVRLNNHGRNKISIDILDALLENCHNFIHLFAVDLLKIIRILLDGDNHAMIISSTTALFIKYCQKNHEEVLLYINDEIMRAINRIHARLSHLSKVQFNDQQKDALKQYEIQSAGLKGLTALASMECFRGIGIAKRIEDFWSAIMFNICFDLSVRFPAGNNKIVHNSALIKPKLLDGEFHEFDSLASLVTNCLFILVSQTTSTTIHLALEPFFASVLDESKDMELLIRIIDQLVPKLETRQMFLLLNEILDIARQRSSHGRVIKFFLSVIPQFIKNDKLTSFPIVALVEPLLTIISIKDNADNSRHAALTTIELIASRPHFYPQIIHAISLFSKKLSYCLSNETNLMHQPLICAKRMLAKLPGTVRLGALDYEDFRVLLSSTGCDDVTVRCLSLLVIGDLLKLSGGLEPYASSLSPFIDLIVGALSQNLPKNSSNKLELWLSTRCVEYLVFNLDVVPILIPHLKLLLNSPPHTASKLHLSSVLVEKIAEVLKEDRLKGVLKYRLPVQTFETASDDFYKPVVGIKASAESSPSTESLDIASADPDAAVLDKIFEILLSHPLLIAKSHFNQLVERTPVQFRDFRSLNQASASPSTPGDVDSDETVDTRVEKSRVEWSPKPTAKPLSKVMTDNVLEFKKALARRISQSGKYAQFRNKEGAGGGNGSYDESGKRKETLTFDEVRNRNTMERKKFEQFLQGL